MATEVETTKIILILVAAYPNAKLIPGGNGVPGTVDVYVTMLSDIPGDQLLAAVKYCINTRPDYMPSVATIRDAAKKLHASGKTAGGMDAWGKVLQAIREVGYMGRPEFEDPAIARTVESIGWRNICMSDEQDFAIRAQFIKAYETFAVRFADEEELLRIPEARRVMEQIAGAVKALRLNGKRAR